MSSFRDFAKKAFSAVKKVFAPKMRGYQGKSTTRGYTPKRTKLYGQSKRISDGMAKIQAFIMRGIILNPIPKRKKKDRSKVKLCTNHNQNKPGYRWFFRCGDNGYRMGRPRPYDTSRPIRGRA